MALPLTLTCAPFSSACEVPSRLSPAVPLTVAFAIDSSAMACVLLMDTLPFASTVKSPLTLIVMLFLVESITILLLPDLSLMVILSLPLLSSRITVWPLLDVIETFSSPCLSSNKITCPARVWMRR